MRDHEVEVSEVRCAFRQGSWEILQSSEYEIEYNLERALETYTMFSCAIHAVVQLS